MKKLTEEMVVARTKISDLSKVKKLNCWGSELSDISLVRRMPNVEVLSLSVNKINTLSDFEHCTNLQELYVRQNDIKDLNQVCYLQNLPNLKHLWLSENPCASTDGYRLSVIRALPQLQKLDNSAVVVEELSEALKRGRILTHPTEAGEESDSQEYQTYQQFHQTQQNQRTTQPYPEQYYSSPERSPPRQESPPRIKQDLRRSYSPEPEQQQAYYEERRNGSYDQEPSRQQYYDEYTNGDRHYQQQLQYKQDGGSDGSNYSHPAYDRLRDRDRCEKNTCPVNHKPPFNRRPVTRNSSILSAVLCLVKELDYASLEVVEMAVRCRMDELNE